MTEAVKPNEKLADAIDATKKAWRRDNNNLAAGGQIQMQFSSIMRTFVDNPEKMMDVATAQSKVAKMDDDRSKPAERDDFRSRVREQRRASGREVEGAGGRDDDRPEQTKQADKPKTAARDTSNDETNTNTVVSEKGDAPAEKTETKARKSFQDDLIDAQEAIIQALPQQQPTDTPVNPALHVQHQQATTELETGAKTVMAGALTDKNFSRVGEDLHDAANAVVTGAKTPQSAGQTAANSLKDEQEGDLANRLAGMGQFQIQVDTAAEGNKARGNAFGGLSANVNFASFDGLDTEARPQSIDPLKSETGIVAGGDQKTPTTHANQAADPRNAAVNAQDIANTFGAAMRAQTALAGQPAATDVKPSIAPAEAIQSIGAAAPAGTSQLSQTAKANPTTAAHQPEKTKEQTAAEQIAVKIRQAVGDGADKINIKLNPHELGRVEVRLEMSKDGSITATVLAERQDTLDMLQKDARGLEKALNDAGLKTDATSLNFGLRGDGQRDVAQGRDRRNGSNNRNDERTAAGRIEFGDKADSVKSAVNSRALNANSGVDIRV